MIEVKLESKSGREGVAVTIGERSLDVLTCTEFFFDTLVNQYVGVDGHTQ